jgi:AcrR family transcriptional regulator
MFSWFFSSYPKAVFVRVAQYFICACGYQVNCESLVRVYGGVTGLALAGALAETQPKDARITMMNHTRDTRAMLATSDGTGQNGTGQRSRTRKGSRTRKALIDEALRQINERGLADTSVLEITQNLNVGNGTFYYHFANMDSLLEEVGHSVVCSLVEQIMQADRADPAAQIARGPLLILDFIVKNPQLRPVMLQVIEDTEGKFADVRRGLRNDVIRGRDVGRFVVENIEMAVGFCQSIIGNAIRHLSDEMDSDEPDKGLTEKRVALLAAVHSLAMLGVPMWEAHVVAEQEQASIQGM